MIFRNDMRAWFAAVALGVALVGCSDTNNPSRSTSITGPSLSADVAESDEADDDKTIYDQVDFLGNPLVSEVTILKARHAAYNTTQPYNSAQFRPETEAFVTAFGRPQALATILGSVLYPDILIVESSKNPATAGWLSWALANGWGGRKLTDDVVDAGLSAIFGDLVVPDAKLCVKFTLPLCTDNVGSNDAQFKTTFPYLADPHT
jgi:hypothetical protein